MLQVRVVTGCTRYSRGVAGAVTSQPPPPPPVHRRQHGLITRRLTRVSLQRLLLHPRSRRFSPFEDTSVHAHARTFRAFFSYPRKYLESVTITASGIVRPIIAQRYKYGIKPRITTNRRLSSPNESVSRPPRIADDRKSRADRSAKVRSA